MPELPEVETVCRGLRKKLERRILTAVEVRHEGVLHQPGMDGKQFAQILQGQRIDAIVRRGKYIIFVLDGGWLLCHLRMTGKLLVRSAETQPGKHVHVVFGLNDGRRLFYEDARRFGGFVYMSEDPWQLAPLAGLGPEPLTEAFDSAYLKRSAQRRRRPVKSHLLDQTVVAGIGNIYADEILFRAGVRPKKSTARLTRKDCEAIVCATKGVLTEAIRAGGSTIRDYVDSDNREGTFQMAHQVYGRAGESCRVCGTSLKSVIVGGRSSVYCPHCQKS